MRISDWSSDVCSSDLQSHVALAMAVAAGRFPSDYDKRREFVAERKEEVAARIGRGETIAGIEVKARQEQRVREMAQDQILQKSRSEEHTSELQSLMRISYAVFCLKKKNNKREKSMNKVR